MLEKLFEGLDKGERILLTDSIRNIVIAVNPRYVKFIEYDKETIAVYEGKYYKKYGDKYEYVMKEYWEKEE